MNFLTSLAVTAALCTSVGSAHALSYSVTNLGGLSSTAMAINNAGQVVGIARAEGSPHYHAVLWSGGSYTDLGAGLHDESFAYDINDAGQIVGAVQTRYDGRDTHSLATLWHNGTTTHLSGTGWQYSVARTINSAGVIGGQHSDFEWNARPALWNGGTMAYVGEEYGTITGINDHDQLVGNMVPFAYGRPARWDGVTWNQLDPQGESVDAINDAGVAVGRGSPYSAGFAWSDTGGSLLGDTRSSGARDINEAGVAVGWRNAGGPNWRAVVWQDGQMLDLMDLIVGDRAGFATLDGAYGINDLGQIVGRGRTASGYDQAFLLTPVPEPEHWVMLAAGLVALGWKARWRS